MHRAAAEGALLPFFLRNTLERVGAPLSLVCDHLAARGILANRKGQVSLQGDVVASCRPWLGIKLHNIDGKSVLRDDHLPG
jgi:hypothetical protein